MRPFPRTGGGSRRDSRRPRVNRRPRFPLGAVTKRWERSASATEKKNTNKPEIRSIMLNQDPTQKEKADFAERGSEKTSEDKKQS
jgi:hypothetical protein